MKQLPVQITFDELNEIEACAHRTRSRLTETCPTWVEDELSDEGKILNSYIFKLLGHIQFLTPDVMTPNDES